MSDSIDNTKDLDSYGVWVKNTPQDATEVNDLDFASELDLPDFEETNDFSDTDFSDMFKDDNEFSIDSNVVDIESNPLDEIEENSEDILQNNSDETFDIPIDSDISIENFGDFESSPVNNSEPVEEMTEDSFEEVSFDENEEISLDDFMDGGFSDESVAIGNRGMDPETAAAAAASSEEISLDDFLDTDSFEISESQTSKEDEIIDEQPLDMSLEFDSSVDSIETEDNVTAPTTDDYYEDDYEEEVIETSEKVDVEETYIPSSSDNIDAEEIDLSDFGIDASAEETAVTQDVQEQKNKEQIIDYDLSVGNEKMTTAPIVSEIKDNDNSELIEEPEELENLQSSTPVDSSLLQQIINDLSSLKSEISMLKNNLEEIKSTNLENPTNIESNIVEDEIIPNDDNNESHGFFENDDSDDTIALSTDELSNILNTADFNEDITQDVYSDDGIPNEIPVNESTIVSSEYSSDGDKVLDLDNQLSDQIIQDDFDFANIEDDEELPEEISIPKEEDDDDNSTILAAGIGAATAIAGAAIVNEVLNDTTEENADSIENEITEDSIIEEPDFEIEETSVNEDEVFDSTIEEVSFDEQITESQDEIFSDEPVISETDEIESQITEENFDSPFSVEEPITEEPITEEPITEEPITEEPITEEPISEEIISEEITPEETISEENNELIEDISDTISLDSVPNEDEIIEDISDDTALNSIEKSEEIIEDIVQDEIIDEDISDDNDIFGNSISFDNETLEEPLLEDDTLVTEESIIDESILEDEESNIETTTEDVLESNEVDIIDPLLNNDDALETSDFDDTFDSSFFNESETSEIDNNQEEILVEEAVEDVEIEDSIDTFDDFAETAVDIDEVISDENIIEDSVEIEEDLLSNDGISTENQLYNESEDETLSETDAFDSVDDIFNSDENLSEELANDDDSLLEEGLAAATIASTAAIASEFIDNEPTLSESESSDDDTLSDINFSSNDFVNIEEDNNDLSESNIDYLTTENNKELNNQSTDLDNNELKNDIKSVLLYMDQLLENLPEDKIMEFAQSEEFSTYKKLFSELGLS